MHKSQEKISYGSTRNKTLKPKISNKIKDVTEGVFSLIKTYKSIRSSTNV